MNVRFTSVAYKDISLVYDYIAKDDPVVAQKILDHIENLINKLAVYPKLGKQGRIPSTHELIVPNTPFIVVYSITPSYINILAIIHTSRRWY